MPEIGNCDAPQIIVALRFYHGKLSVGEMVELPIHPSRFERGKFHFPLSQWKAACRAARRLALVSLQTQTGNSLYLIRNPVWETARLNLVAQRGFKAGDFDNWIWSAQAERDFQALPLLWKTAAAQELLGEHSAEFLARTRAFWEKRTGRKVVEVPSPKLKSAQPPALEQSKTNQPAHNTLQWKLRRFLNRP
jgi:hypothetical protein